MCFINCLLPESFEGGGGGGSQGFMQDFLFGGGGTVSGRFTKWGIGSSSIMTIRVFWLLFKG